MYSFFKRIFDIFFSLAVLLILFFPLIFIGLLIKTSSKGPIFYKWKVVGKDGLYFTGLKFRTMVTNADNLKESLKSSNEMEGPFFKMNNDPRICSHWINECCRPKTSFAN